MRILGIEDGSGCGYWRMHVPLYELARHGHEVTMVNRKEGPVSLREADQYDVIVGERLDDLDGVTTWRRSRKPRNRLVYENDDDVFSITQENWAAYNHFGKNDVQEAVRAYCEVSDMVTVTNETLARVFREFNPRVAVLPNFLPDIAFKAESSAPKGRPLAVGWIGASSHGRDVHVATPSVRRFIKRFSDWDVYLGGTDYRASFKIRVDRITFGGWIEGRADEERYFSAPDNFDIGIAPLLDKTFARSKSPLKVMEFGARGIPTIASDVLPYRNYIEHGVDGFLAKNDHEWLEYLSLLAADHGLRARMGAAAMSKAKEHRIADHWKLWETAYSSLFGVKLRKEA